MTTMTVESGIVRPPWIPSRAVLRRAFVLALVIGSALTAVNQFGAVAGGATFEALPMALVFLTPFVVIAISQMLGIRRAIRDAAQGRSGHVPREAFLVAVRSHGIPRRAVVVGILAGGVNTAISAVAGYLESGTLGPLPTALLAQAFTLPIIFGSLSQTLAYRRAVASISSRTPGTASRS